MSQNSQLELPNLLAKTKKVHGGSESRNKRKIGRPLAIKKSHHIVIRSTKAVGPRALIRHSAKINNILQKASKRFGVKIYRKAICWNHIHLSIKGYSRLGLQNFFRVVCGHIAQEILKLSPLNDKKSSSNKYERKFWNDLVFSRIVEWGKDFEDICAYIIQNALEAEGLAPYKPRGKKKIPIKSSPPRKVLRPSAPNKIGKVKDRPSAD